MRIALLFPALLLCAGCAHRAAVAPPMVPGWISPPEAVHAANDDPHRGIRGSFVVTVQAVGEDERRIYLNTERDYRHQLNLTIALDRSLRDALQAQLGLPLEQLHNHRLLVQGTARRVRIDFTPDGRPSGKYYFQTHVDVTDPRQVRLAP